MSIFVILSLGVVEVEVFVEFVVYKYVWYVNYGGEDVFVEMVSDDEMSRVKKFKVGNSFGLGMLVFVCFFVVFCGFFVGVDVRGIGEFLVDFLVGNVIGRIEIECVFFEFNVGGVISGDFYVFVGEDENVVVGGKLVLDYGWNVKLGYLCFFGVDMKVRFVFLYESNIRNEDIFNVFVFGESFIKLVVVRLVMGSEL